MAAGRVPGFSFVNFGPNFFSHGEGGGGGKRKESGQFVCLAPVGLSIRNVAFWWSANATTTS